MPVAVVSSREHTGCVTVRKVAAEQVRKVHARRTDGRKWRVESLAFCCFCRSRCGTVRARCTGSSRFRHGIMRCTNFSSMLFVRCLVGLRSHWKHTDTHQKEPYKTRGLSVPRTHNGTDEDSLPTTPSLPPAPSRPPQGVALDTLVFVSAKRSIFISLLADDKTRLGVCGIFGPGWGEGRWGPRGWKLAQWPGVLRKRSENEEPEVRASVTLVRRKKWNIRALKGGRGCWGVGGLGERAGKSGEAADRRFFASMYIPVSRCGAQRSQELPVAALGASQAGPDIHPGVPPPSRHPTRRIPPVPQLFQPFSSASSTVFHASVCSRLCAGLEDEPSPACRRGHLLPPTRAGWGRGVVIPSPTWRSSFVRSRFPTTRCRGSLCATGAHTSVSE